MSTPGLRLTYAGGRYDRTAALINGEIVPEGIELNYLPLPSHETFWRMLQFTEFDASELSCANYFMVCSRGDRRFVALPIFPSRMFRHSGVYVNTAAGIRQPSDLKGRRVGVAEYPMTAAVWVRAFLQHDYGVQPSDITWIQGGLEQPGRRDRVGMTPPPGVRIENAANDKYLVGMLEAGEIDALVAPSMPSVMVAGSPKVGRLFPEYWTVEADYYRRTGHFPIMHTVVLRREIYEQNVWAAAALVKAFERSKELAMERLYEADALHVSLAWTVAYVEQERALRGHDIWPYGFETNRQTLEALKGYLAEQGLLSGDFKLEDVFAPNTLAMSRL
jgi:4,5-dihydroxyphthalate decarboxylase